MALRLVPLCTEQVDIWNETISYDRLATELEPSHR
jgi:hypothetical protein